MDAEPLIRAGAYLRRTIVTLERMNPSQPSNRTLFRTKQLRAYELDASDIGALQRFFTANPEYFISVNGMPPRSDEAQREFDDGPPPGMPFEKRWMIGFVDDTQRLVGIASVLSNFLAEHVWHIGLFMIETAMHGTGKSSEIYLHLEDWMKLNGARWVRLGAVVGNLKAERFWEKLEYAEVRRRTGVQTGNLTSTIRVFVKALSGGTTAEYLSLVERDRPESLLP